MLCSMQKLWTPISEHASSSTNLQKTGSYFCIWWWSIILGKRIRFKSTRPTQSGGKIPLSLFSFCFHFYERSVHAPYTHLWGCAGPESGYCLVISVMCTLRYVFGVMCDFKYIFIKYKNTPASLWMRICVLGLIIWNASADEARWQILNPQMVKFDFTVNETSTERFVVDFKLR